MAMNEVTVWQSLHSLPLEPPKDQGRSWWMELQKDKPTIGLMRGLLNPAPGGRRVQGMEEPPYLQEPCHHAMHLSPPNPFPSLSTTHTQRDFRCAGQGEQEALLANSSTATSSTGTPLALHPSPLRRRHHYRHSTSYYVLTPGTDW